MNKAAAKTKPSPRKRPRTVTKKMRASGSYTLVHDWEILKGERIRRWPSLEDPRTVTISISSWAGFAPGASHFHLTIEVRPQQYWCEDKNCWVEVSSQSAPPYTLRASVPREGDAQRLAAEFIKIVKLDKSQLWRFVGDTCNTED